MLELFLILITAGMMAGMLGGLLGIGGGILIMPILRFGIGLDPAFAAGTCIVAVFFTTLGGSLEHFKLGHIDIRSILPVMIAGLLSSLAFSLLFVHFTEKDLWLDMATGVIFSWVALLMLWEGITDYRHKAYKEDPGTRIQGSMLGKISIGGVAGIFPGLLGIGTGAVLVPAFSFALNAPVKIAIGSSLACFSLNALISATMKFSQGFVQIPILVPLCIGTLIGARFGATFNERFSSPLLKILFGAVFVYVACKYLMVIGEI